MSYYKLMLLTAAVVVSGCSNLSADKRKIDSNIPTLESYEIRGSTAYIRMTDYGCSLLNSLQVSVVDKKQQLLKVTQVKADNCDWEQRIIQTTFSIVGLGLDLDKEIRIINPIVPSQ